MEPSLEPIDNEGGQGTDETTVNPDLLFVFESLVADFKRQNRLELKQIERLADKRKLSIAEISTLRDMLVSEGILVPMEDEQLDLQLSDDDTLLSAEEEIELARRISLGKRLEDEENVHSEPENLNAASIRKNADEARRIMTEKNQKLVAKIARRYEGRSSLDLQDLIQEGNFGLMTAVERFDPDRGCRFYTYAWWWVMQSIMRAMADTGATVRFPVHLVDSISRYRRCVRNLTREHSRPPGLKAVADCLGWDVDKVMFIKDLSSTDYVSFDEPVSTLSRATLEDIIPSELPSPLDLAEQSESKRFVTNVINSLKEKQADIIRLRFGIKDGRDRTLEEIGALKGVTRERIRQIEAKSLALMRRRLIRAGFADREGNR